MNVLFVHSEEDHYSTDKPLESYERMQFGISYISSVLKGQGHGTRLVVPTRQNEEIVEEHIRQFAPGLVCFTSVYAEFSFMSRIAARVKRSHPDIFLLVGGPHASLKPEECLEEAFDAVCVGEGEYPTLELVEQLESGASPSGIPNLLIKRGSEVERNEPRPFLENLDALPFPDREMWAPWVANPLSRPSVLVGRGCPFQCTYCCNHALLRLADGKYVRYRSAENIVEELRNIKEALPLLQEVYLEVETLGVNPGWAIDLCARLENMNAAYEVPIQFGSNLRVTPNSDYRELFAALKRCNFRFINIGLESGSERVRRDILKRNYSNQDIISAVRLAKENGLEVGIYNLIGLPGETTKDFRETARLNRACQPNWFLLSVFFPYPGTALYDTSLEMGLLDGPLDTGLERRRPVLDQPRFTKRQVQRRYTWSHLLFYGGHRPIGETAWMVVMTKLHTNPRLLKYWKAFKRWRSPYKQL
jgi:anaerobic magnesium-protoporphyrin IX monomethyl ester cyclase